MGPPLWSSAGPGAPGVGPPAGPRSGPLASGGVSLQHRVRRCTAPSPAAPKGFRSLHLIKPGEGNEGTGACEGSEQPLQCQGHVVPLSSEHPRIYTSSSTPAPLRTHLRVLRTLHAPSGRTVRTASFCFHSRCLHSSGCRSDSSYLREREQVRGVKTTVKSPGTATGYPVCKSH